MSIFRHMLYQISSLRWKSLDHFRIPVSLMCVCVHMPTYKYTRVSVWVPGFVLLSATVNCMQLCPVKPIHPDFLQPTFLDDLTMDSEKLEKPLFLFTCLVWLCVPGLSLHGRHPLREKRRALWDVGSGGNRERKSKLRRLEWKRWRACCSFVSHLLLGLSCPLPVCPAC